MTLSLSIATIALFSKKFTIWSYDYDTFQLKIGQCDFEDLVKVLEDLGLPSISIYSKGEGLCENNMKFNLMVVV